MFRHFGFFNPVSAPFKPAGFRRTICARRQNRRDAPNARTARRRRQARDRELRSGQHISSQRIRLDDPDFRFADFIGKAHLCIDARRHRDILRTRRRKQIPLRRCLLTDAVSTRRQVTERRRAICPGRLRLHDAAGAAQKLKDGSRQQRAGLRTLLAHRDRAVRHFKIQRRRKDRIRLPVYRQNQLLNVLIGDAHIEARLIIRRRHDLNRHGELALAGRDGDRIAAVHVIVFAIAAAGVTRHCANRCTDAQSVRARIQRCCADVLAA